MGDRDRRAICALSVFLVVQFAIGAGLVGHVFSASPIILETIRGGRHPGYASIVFQFDGRAFSEIPVVHGNEVVFKLKNVETGLVPFRQYKSFDSWVMLEQAATDVNVRIGLPENFSRMAHFLMENPDRLVINLHEKKPSAPPLAEKTPSQENEPPPPPAKKPLRALALVAQEAPPSSSPVEKEKPEKQATPPEAPAPESVQQGSKTIKKSSKIAEQISVDGLTTLNFHEVDIRELLSALAIKRKTNIVMAQDVSGKVSLHLYRVTLNEALDAISLAGGFSHMKHGTTHFIYKPKEEKDPEAERLQMRIFELKYAEVDKVQEVLDAIPGNRVIKLHEPSRTVIVEDTPENIKKIETIIRFWDRKPRQVLIEAKILQIRLTDEMSMGVNWDKILGDARIGTGGFSIAVPPAEEGISPVPDVGSGVFANMITAAGTRHEFSVAVDALQAKTRVNTLSTPKLLAIHGKQARVQVGGQQGYKVTTLTGTGLATETIEFLDIGTILDITPYIDDDGNVLLNVKPSINSVTIDAATGVPTQKSTAVSTWLLAKGGETVFIAGLIEEAGTKTGEMVPCLGNAPGLGWLFRGTSRGTGKDELVVLITPEILESARKRVDEEAIEKADKLEQEFKKEPQPPYQEFFDLLWE
jgi:type II secretory pathway component GspD/PulD (secretin)